MIRSKAPRSTTRSLMTGKAVARQGSMSMRVAVLEAAHVELAGGGARRAGRAAAPLITTPHVPQIPSRQSWSKAIGSSPFWISPSLTTSSISRNDMSGLTSFGLVGDEAARVASASFCRQTCRVRFILHCRSLVAPLRRGGRSRRSAARRCGSGFLPSPVYSQAATWQKCSSSRSASPSVGLVLLAEVAAAGLLALERVAGTSARRARGSRPRGRPSPATGSAPRRRPSTLTFFQNSSRSAGIFCERRLEALPRCAPCRSTPT